MPELPEVETVVRSLARSLTGRRIASVAVLHKPSVRGSPAPLECLCGRRVLKVFRRGKFIRADLERGLGLAIHLRMTGWLGLLPLPVRAATVRERSWQPLAYARGSEPAGVSGTGGATAGGTPALQHVRVWFGLDGGAERLVFRDARTFGRVWCGPTDVLEELPALARLGPEPLGLDRETFARRLRARRGRLKTLLLNQEFIAGIGNIYADEVLFAANLHPLTKAENVPAARAFVLHAAIGRVLAAAIRAGGTSISDFLRPDGRPGWFRRQLKVYGREGKPCGRCGGPIKRIVVGQRGTWFCPCCQRRA